jgi:pimeloyl-ACP methyl ester carboxylesterase
MNTYAVNGISMATVDRGRGAAVLLVHGFPLDHSMWDAQIEPLAERFRVLVPDLRGFGRSGVTEGSVSMEQYADDLAALLDRLEIDEPIVICGLSMGGYITLEFWRKYAARIRGLILCDTKAAPDTPEAAAGRLQTADRLLREGAQPLAEQMLPRLLAPGTRENRPEIAESLRRVILSNDPKGLAAAQRGMSQRGDSRPFLPAIDRPALVLVGEFDAISTGEEMRAIAGAMPNARFTTIAASGHLPPVENPPATSDALRSFLATLG